mgnify:CR=1 FL=1
MPNSRFLLLTLMLASTAWGEQPWEANEFGRLMQENAKSLPREARPRHSPERFDIIQADGNYVAPRYQAGDEAKLMQAVRQNDIEAVRTLLKAGANPNIGDYWKDVPLLQAVRQDNLEAVQLLLDQGAIPDIKGRGYTPLGLASKNGNVPLVKMLLRAQADPNRKNDDGDTPLHSAALLGHATVITALASAKPDMALFNREGLTPLAVAASNGQYAAADALIRNGSPLETGDRKSHSPLWWAFSVGDFDMARLLLKHGAAPGQLPIGALE